MAGVPVQERGACLGILREPLELDTVLTELAEGVRVNPPLAWIPINGDLMLFAQIHQHLECLAAFLDRREADDLPTVASESSFRLGQDRRSFRFCMGFPFSSMEKGGAFSALTLVFN